MTYEERLAKRVQQFKAKWPDRYAEHERKVIAFLAPPLKYQRDGYPEVVRNMIDTMVAECIRREMNWPSEAQFQVHA